MGKKKEVKEESKEVVREVENIISRHMNKETKQYKVGDALIELEQAVIDRDLIIGRLENRVMKLEDAMSFFSSDWSKRFGNSIILPTDSEIKEFKK